MVALLRMPMHPYAIRQEVIELTNQRIWPAYMTIHSAIKSLVKKELVTESENSLYWLKARRSVPYELTDKGIEIIEKELNNYSHVVAEGRLLLQQSQSKPDLFGF